MLTRRASILIDKVFQYKFCFFAVSWIFTLSLLYPVVIAQVFSYFILIGQGRLPEAVLSQVKDTQAGVIRMVIFFHVVFLAVVALTTLFLSHRIAGPLYKLKQTFQACRPGKILKAVTFRKADYFQDLADEYSKMMTAIELKREAALQSLDSALKSAQGESKERIQEAISHLNGRAG